jgi:copper chaperone CopZ
MCCILPLGLGALGLSTTVVAAFFEPLRPWFLALAAALLGTGVYFSLRTPAGEVACSTVGGRLSKLSKPALSITAVAVLALALFPTIAGFASSGSEDLATTAASEVVVFRVEGMTCEACAPGIRTALQGVPGVIDAAVLYDEKRAEVRCRTERPPETSTLIEAIQKAGYSATVVSK